MEKLRTDSKISRAGHPSKVRWVKIFALLAGVCAGAQGALAADADVPPQPSEPAAAKAYGVFDQACAGCHQMGRLKNLKRPAGSLGNILDLEALARNPSWVVPGNPYGSPLYTSMQSRSMPVAGTADAAPPDLTASDLANIRDWIEQLPAVTACGGRDRIGPGSVVATIGGSIRGLTPAQSAGRRFISLVPLYNACAGAADILSARQAIVWLINSLSLAPEPVRLESIDPEGLILQLDLVAIGWDAQRWDRLAARAPAAPFTVLPPATLAALKTSTPVVNADWLAATASRAPVYYDVLGMPETLPTLLASLRIDRDDTKRGAAHRIGLRASAVARGNRLLERRTFGNGAAWFSSEFAPTAGRPDLFDLTIAAAAVVPAKGTAAVDERPPPVGDATLVHFELPNGFPAFFVANTSGVRINDVPLSILRDLAHPSTPVAVAQSCLGCHGGSPVALAPGQSDDLKARLTAEPSLSKETREKLLAFHGEPVDLQRKISEDQARFLRVAAAAGVDPARLWEGQELLPALVARYARAVTLVQLADWVDLEPKAVQALGKGLSAPAADVLNRLAFGPVPRADVDAILPEIAVKRGLRAPAATSQALSTAPAAEPATSVPRLVLETDRQVFQTGDLLAVTVRSNRSCYLTVLTLDARGRATVLYPNEFDANNFVDAGRDLRIPGDKAPYQFRLRDKGQETLIGICAGTAKPVDGIRHNFESHRFTELGDYRAFLNRHWGARETVETKAGKPGAAKGSEPLATSREPQARTAIRIVIE